MSVAFKPGDVLRVIYSGLVDGEIKVRRVLFWMYSQTNQQRILISPFHGTVTNRKWELRYSPKPGNGLSKNCVLRISDTHYLDIGSIPKLLGHLDQIDFADAKNMMIEYSDYVKNSSPEDFDCDPFSIFTEE